MARARAKLAFQDPIQGLGRPMARARAKLAQETLERMVVNLMEAQLYHGAQHVEAHT